MAETAAARDTPVTSVGGRRVAAPVVEVLRDVARGGIAGILVGIFVAGIGGRIVMRLATIRHEDAVGLLTENGELIGRISVNGTLALITFGGLGMGLLAGTIWVVVSPWLPGRGLSRAGLTGLAAVALGTPPLVQRFNPDFLVLRHDPVVVALLVALVGLVGVSIALVDDALERRLPHPAQLFAASGIAYLLVTVLGLVILPVVVSILLDQDLYDAPLRAGWALVVTGLCTLAWWVIRVRGRAAPPGPLRLVASASVLVAVVLGGITTLPNVLGAAGLD